MTRSVFRFVSSARRGSYSVHRGDEHFGYVEKSVTRWVPTTLDRRELASEPTREAAARVLWALYQRERR